MGANPEFTGRHEIQKPHLDTPAGAQAAEDEWIINQNAEQEQMAAMDDWDVFNKQGVEEEGELGNGYGDHHAVDGEDFFPSGATSNVSRKVGPSGARHGDNPMSKRMATESAKIYEQYKRDFENFKKIDEDKEPKITFEFEEAFDSDTEIDGPFKHLGFRIYRNQQFIGRIYTAYRAKKIEYRNKAGEVIETWPPKSYARIEVGEYHKGNHHSQFFDIPPEVAVDQGGQKLLALVKNQVPEVYNALKNYKADKFVNRVKDAFRIGWQDSKKD